MCLRQTVFLAVFWLYHANCAFAFDNGDTQYWNTESISWKINDVWAVKLEEEFRFGDNASDFFYQHSDLGLTYSGFAQWLALGLNYRGIFEESKNNWQYENRPHLNVVLKTKVNDIRISNRSRLEFRIRKSVEDKTRYRNKSTIKLPVKWSRFEWQPYIADEIFLEFESTEMTRNRLYAGFGGKLNKYLGLEFYYILETKKSSDDWKDTNVLGTKLKLLF